MPKINFPQKGEYYIELRNRVEKYFINKDIKHTGNWKMYLKTFLILVLFASSYVSLVFFSNTLTMAIVSAFFLAQAFILIGFNIMHDGNHGSYSKNKTINKIMGYTLDLIGGSHMLWKQKHNVLHHTYTNINGMDEDISTSGILRLSPNQKWRFWHKFQHIYAFPVYSLLTLSWIVVGDFVKLFTRKIGTQNIKKLKFEDNLFFYSSKTIYFGYMIVLPLFFHPITHVLIFFLFVHLILGFTLSIVFQLAHTVEQNTFPVPEAKSGNIDNEWAIHQIETTANFAPENKLAAWYLGGLNFQVEHHLFTKICHVHYPQISKIVNQTSKEFSVEYISYPTVLSAIIAHLKFLKRMSIKPQPALIA